MIDKEHMDSFRNALLHSQKVAYSNVTLPCFEYKKNYGRLEISLIAMLIGNDLQVIIYGGDAHIGATAVAKPGEDTRVITCMGHREDEMAMKIANIMSKDLDCTICVSIGIHYDNILKQEIELLNLMAYESANAVLEKVKNFKYNTKSS